jgi:hypothetical protein
MLLAVPFFHHDSSALFRCFSSVDLTLFSYDGVLKSKHPQLC